jgi:sec-independent protein translocase protein TatA
MLTTFGYWTGWEGWLIAAGVFILLFGGTKIPQLAKGLGEGIREFKKSVTDEEKSEASSKSETDSETK